MPTEEEESTQQPAVEAPKPLHLVQTVRDPNTGKLVSSPSEFEKVEPVESVTPVE